MVQHRSLSSNTKRYATGASAEALDHVSFCDAQVETAAYIADKLRSFGGIAVTEQIGITGTERSMDQNSINSACVHSGVVGVLVESQPGVSHFARIWTLYLCKRQARHVSRACKQEKAPAC